MCTSCFDGMMKVTDDLLVEIGWELLYPIYGAEGINYL